MNPGDMHDEQLVELTLAGLERRSTDAALEQRLGAARRTAVASIATRPLAAPRPWIPAALVGATLLGVGALVTQLPGETMLPLDEETLAAQHLELLEDIELYAWMVELDVGGAS